MQPCASCCTVENSRFLPCQWWDLFGACPHVLPHKKRRRKDRRSNSSNGLRQATAFAARKNKRSIDFLMWPPYTMTICVCVHRLPISPPSPCSSIPCSQACFVQEEGLNIHLLSAGRQIHKQSRHRSLPPRPAHCALHRHSHEDDTTKYGQVALGIVVAAHV